MRLDISQRILNAPLMLQAPRLSKSIKNATCGTNSAAPISARSAASQPVNTSRANICAFRHVRAIEWGSRYAQSDCRIVRRLTCKEAKRARIFKRARKSVQTIRLGGALAGPCSTALTSEAVAVRRKFDAARLLFCSRRHHHGLCAK